MTRFVGELAAALAVARAGHRYRSRRAVEARTLATTRVQVDGRECLAFCSNDYLGLAQHPAIVDAMVAGVRRWGVSSGGSHLVSGHTGAHRELEDRLAEFVGRPRALLFSTGYMANLAVGAALLGRADRVFEDRLNHASLLDAGLMSGARFSRFRHADVAALRRRLASPARGRTLVVTDGVFSMDGDVAPLRDLAVACRRADAVLMIDDAHGFGVNGPSGRGSVAEAGLGEVDVPVLMATLGKAIGTFGAFVAGSEELIETLIQRGRTYIYTTALPPAIAEATLAALAIVRDEDWRRDRLRSHVSRFRAAARDLGYTLADSSSPIQPLLVGDERTALSLSSALQDAGIWVPAIRPPTVPRGGSRLRVTFSAAHETADIDRLIDVLASIPRAEDAR
jgi:8-amino-7-oxononanoate synthase